jgi:hypothetical protein
MLKSIAPSITTDTWPPRTSFDRTLLNGLSRAAYTAILAYMGALMGAGYAPGMIIARQTFGEGARFHPHLHALLSSISMERLWYDPQAGKVTLRPLAGEKAEPVELGPLEFIARLVQHIPDVRERQVVYYGVYANASKRLPTY